ncbi:MAG TPA: hypothetical protein VK450_02595 [Methanomicrobiales archaeon]|nr:hypothetical protein [Methanomicrobiales archaeon]
MVDLREIPEATRWQIATRILSSLPVMYDMAFRGAVGKTYDELEYQVWLELGKDALDIAKAFQLPVGRAAELARALRLITVLIFGPEFRYEVLEISMERATLITKTCPFLGSTHEYGGTPKNLFPKCLAFSIAVVETLNPRFTARFVRSLCMADRTCEMTVLTKEEAKKLAGSETKG